MSKFTEEELYALLGDVPQLPDGMTPPQGEEYSLESILAEFGQGAAEPAPITERTEEPPVKQEEAEPASDEQEPSADTVDLQDIIAAAVEQTLTEETNADSASESVDAERPDAEETTEESEDEELSTPAGEAAERDTTADEAEESEQEEPDEADGDESNAEEQTISLERLMAQTVESVLEDEEPEEEREPLRERLERWCLGVVEGIVALTQRRRKREALWEDEELPEEPDMEQAAKETKRRCKKLRRALLLLTIPTLLLAAWAALDALGILPELWRMDAVRFGVSGGGLLLAMLMALSVWREAGAELKKRRFGCEAAACCHALVVLADCVCGVVRGSTELPFAAPSAVMLWMCLWGMLRQTQARWEAFHLADLAGEPPYSASVTAVGACKQRGKLRGFHYLTHKDDAARQTQTYLVPLLLVAAVVLSGVVCLGEQKMDRFLWICSAILTASLPLSLPLLGALPLSLLNRRLARSGSAVAGYQGAALVGTAKRIVMTDDDLFPPGTVSMNGLKLYGEEIGKVVSYVATLAKASGSQLSPLFEQLLASEGGVHLRLEELQYYEEGGVGGLIHGESVIMGTAYFMKKQKVELPRQLKIKTGVFLAVDRHLVAIFAMDYRPSRNVEWALRALRRNHIQMVLGVRSGNITPGLLRRRFKLNTKALYPDISTRLALSALSEEETVRPGALIYREGLLPFAETVIGSRRLVSAVRLSTLLCYIGAAAGLLLGYYLAHTGAYAVLSPIRMLVFLLLWLVPTLLLSGTVKHF